MEPASELHKYDIMGRTLLNYLIKKDVDRGATVLEVVGSPGAGKTSVLLFLAETLMKRYPLDKYFWSNPFRSPLQVVKLRKDCFDLLIEANSNIIFRDRNTGLKIDLPYTEFNDFEDAWVKAKPSRLTTIFFGDRTKLMEFFAHTLSKNLTASFFVDELGEICAAQSPNPMLGRIIKFCQNLKEARKCDKNFFYASQTKADTDWRVRSKIQMEILLGGSKESGRIWQRAIDCLNKSPVFGNSAWIQSMGSEFGLIKFSKIFKPIPSQNWECVINGQQTNKINV